MARLITKSVTTVRSLKRSANPLKEARVRTRLRPFQHLKQYRQNQREQAEYQKREAPGATGQVAERYGDADPYRPANCCPHRQQRAYEAALPCRHHPRRGTE